MSLPDTSPALQRAVPDAPPATPERGAASTVATLLRGYDRTLGMNRRNFLIARTNPAVSIRLVDDKHATKQALTAHEIPVSSTLAIVRDRQQLATLDMDSLPDEWAIKPNQSLGGTGILLSVGRHPDGGWRTGSGRRLTPRAVSSHLRLVLDGEFSPRGRDAALVEPLIRSHADLDRLSFQGLADIRVICTGAEPRLAMLRLPTSESGGRANLHQRAIGAAVDLDTGRVTGAWTGAAPVTRHPDSGEHLIGAQVPDWDVVLQAASRCGQATGLRYVGADIVVDRDSGPLVLEVNARPGLQIQKRHRAWSARRRPVGACRLNRSRLACPRWVFTRRKEARARHPSDTTITHTVPSVVSSTRQRR